LGFHELLPLSSEGAPHEKVSGVESSGTRRRRRSAGLGWNGGVCVRGRPGQRRVEARGGPHPGEERRRGGGGVVRSCGGGREEDDGSSRNKL